MQALRRLGSELGVLVLWLVHFLPLRFPQMPEAERHALGLKHFRMLGRNAVELSIMVWGSERQLLDLIRVEGLEHLTAAAEGGRPVIALAPHFIGLNMGGIRVAHQYPGTASIYSKQKNPVLDWLFLKART